MASLDTPKTWIPYMNIKDCSQGFCSLHCPQWCYIIFPPPPPPFDDFSDDNSSSTFSPLIIAIIGILASALILVSYYTIISKYCGNSSNRRRENNDQDERNQEFDHQDDQDQDPVLHEPWNVSTTGLDEALIKKITMCKYKKGDGLIEGTDCSVCLSEFQENESIRLLPKCSHAFHVSCIDTWLQSHSNCPLCRSNILYVTSSLPLPPPPPPPPPVLEAQDSDSEQDITVQNDDPAAQRTPVRALSDLGNLEKRDTIIEMREIERLEHVRRSFSMDRVSIADMLRMNQEQDCLSEEEAAGSSSKQLSSGQVKCGGGNHRSKRMKRSFSSGRFFISSHGRVRDTILSFV